MVHKFKMRAKQVRTITWWNPAVQMLPVLDSSFFVPHTYASLEICHHSVCSILAVWISCRIIAVFVFRKPLFTILMAPKRKSSDAGSASKPKRSHDVLLISEKVKILDMIEIKKNCLRRLPRCMARMNLPFMKWWRTKKKFHCSVVSWGLG